MKIAILVVVIAAAAVTANPHFNFFGGGGGGRFPIFPAPLFEFFVSTRTAANCTLDARSTPADRPCTVCICSPVNVQNCWTSQGCLRRQRANSTTTTAPPTTTTTLTPPGPGAGR